MNEKKLREAPVEAAVSGATAKHKMLEGVLAQIDKQYGKGSVMRLGSISFSA